MLVLYSFFMDHIGLILPKILKKRGLQSHANASIVLLKTQEWISEQLPDFKDDLHAQTYKDASIIISCSNSIASQECQMRLVELLEYLKKDCFEIPIEQIRLIRSEGKA